MEYYKATVWMPISTILLEMTDYPKRSLESLNLQDKKKSKNTHVHQYSVLEHMKSTIICNFWRNYLSTNTTFTLAKAFTDKGFLVETLQANTFDATITLLKQKDTIDVAKRCLMRVHKLSAMLHGTSHLTNVPTRIHVKVFLSSYLILLHRARVFESMGDAEGFLFESSQKLCMNFEAIMKALTIEKKPFYKISHDLTKSFPILLFNYIDWFKKWKLVDEVKLYGRIKHALVALLEARKLLPLDDFENSEQEKSFLEDLGRLKNKLIHIGGPMKWQQFEKDYPEITTLQISRISQESSSNHEFKNKRMTNEELAHELLLKPTFQLTEAMASGCFDVITQRIRESFREAFWSSLEDDLRLSEPCYARILKLLAEVRDGIAELAGSEVSSQVRELVDIDLISQQTQMKVFDWTQVIQLLTGIVNIIKRVQCTRRDIETATLWDEKSEALENASGEIQKQPSAFCQTLKFLLGRVNAMRVDAANARLRLIAPVVRDHGVEYEKGKMRERLESGEITLNGARTWLKESLLSLVKHYPLLVEQVAQGNATALVKAHGSALVDLIENKNISIPETLLLDTQRIKIMRAQYERLVFYAVVLVTAKNNFALEDEVVTGLVALEAEADRDWKDRCISIGAAAVGSDRLHAYMNVVKKRLSDRTEPVHALMHTRVRAFWESAVGGARALTEELQGVEGLQTIAREWVGELTLMANLNIRVHGPLYDRLMPFAAIEARFPN